MMNFSNSNTFHTIIMQKSILHILKHFAINTLVFMLLLIFAHNKSGGDIFMILFYSIATFLQIIISLFFKMNTETIIGICLAVLTSITVFKIVDKNKAKQKIEMIEGKLNM